MRCTLPGAPPASFRTLPNPSPNARQLFKMRWAFTRMYLPLAPSCTAISCGQAVQHASRHSHSVPARRPRQCIAALGPALPLTQTCMCGDMHLHNSGAPGQSRLASRLGRALCVFAVSQRCFLLICYFFVLQGADVPGTCCVRREVAGHRCASTPHEPVHACADFQFECFGVPLRPRTTPISMNPVAVDASTPGVTAAPGTPAGLVKSGGG